MQFSTTLLAAALSTSALATPLATRQSTVSPLFCTEAGYPAGDPYGEPYGTGWCYGLPAALGECYTWTDFPESQTGPLVNNLTFAFLGNSYECNLYKTSDCTGAAYLAGYGDNDLSSEEFGPTDFDNLVASWSCFST